ncbi:MAG: hypothetical protein WCR52_02290 [Bacteroidota bacterium]
MKNLLFAALFLLANYSFGQTPTTITTIDFVKIKQNKRQEALFYYENNWKVYRDSALQKGYIESYKLLTTTADTTANFDLMLITTYSDSAQYKLNEARFQEIIKTTRPDGPKLLNALKPGDFRQNVFFKQAATLFSAEQTKAKRKTKQKTKSKK